MTYENRCLCCGMPLSGEDSYYHPKCAKKLFGDRNVPVLNRTQDELNALAGERRFGFCLDTGHALLTAQDIQQVMLHLGDRIECFHVHDNNGIEDQHIAPYMGILDWDRFVEGLRSTGYQGALCFETHGAIKVFHPELAPEVLRLIARTGRMFVQKAGLEE